jgi:hypothetical protein
MIYGIDDQNTAGRPSGAVYPRTVSRERGTDVEPNYTGTLKLLFDWQTLIGGILALVAGFVAAFYAYFAGLKQVRAVRDQTREAEAENARLRREGRRALARDGLVAARLIHGVLVRVMDGIKRL